MPTAPAPEPRTEPYLSGSDWALAILGALLLSLFLITATAIAHAIIFPGPAVSDAEFYAAANGTYGEVSPGPANLTIPVLLVRSAADRTCYGLAVAAATRSTGLAPTPPSAVRPGPGSGRILAADASYTLESPAERIYGFGVYEDGKLAEDVLVFLRDGASSKATEVLLHSRATKDSRMFSFPVASRTPTGL